MPNNVTPINPDMTPLTPEDLAVPALGILEMLDSGATKCRYGRCRTCGEHGTVFFQRRRWLRPFGLCLSCLIVRIIASAEAAGPIDE